MFIFSFTALRGVFFLFIVLRVVYFFFNLLFNDGYFFSLTLLFIFLGGLVSCVTLDLHGGEQENETRRWE